jgi:CheY-like chemotaxis protein
MSEFRSALETDPKPDTANILVVDDLSEKLLAYETVLSKLGENLVLVNSGANALKQVLQKQFAVILLDVNMPGMDGFETADLR